MKFSYQLFRGVYYPIIPVKISRDVKEINTSAIVDSGASISIFSSSVGRQIGIDILTKSIRNLKWSLYS